VHPSDMNNLQIERQIAVISALVEGNSIRATVRMTGVAKDTVIKLLAKIGQACAEYQDKNLRNLPRKRIQCDEIWSFCYAKEKNVPADLRGFSSAVAMFGHGRLSALTRRLFLAGALGGSTHGTRRISCTISLLLCHECLVTLGVFW
jgi:hypothetical protein